MKTFEKLKALARDLSSDDYYDYYDDLSNIYASKKWKEKLDYLFQNVANVLSVDMMESAAADGNVEILKYLYEKGMVVNSLSLETAALNGNLDAIKWMMEELEQDTLCVLESIRLASHAGHLEVVKYLFGHVKKMIINSSKVAKKSKNDEIYKFLVEETRNILEKI